jgi:CRP-like cAMP-binding protein
MDQSLLFHKLNDVAATIELPKDSILFQSGDAAKGLYLIRSGRVALHWGTVEHDFLQESVGSGEIVGLAAALKGIYDATARLAEDADLGYVPLHALYQLEDCCPAVGRAITELIAYRVICRRAAFRGV